jgi:predicted nucleic acid-binding protein
VLIVDTGPLVATADRSDKDHAACRELLESDEGPLATTAMVIAEAAYPIDRQLGAKAEASLYASIIEGQMEVADLDIDDWQRVRDLVTTYADLRLGGTDASVVALAEHRGANRIATLSRRHSALVTLTRSNCCLNS